MILHIRQDNFYKIKFEFSNIKNSFSNPISNCYKHVRNEDELFYFLSNEKKISLNLYFNHEIITSKWDKDFIVLKKLELNFQNQKIIFKRIGEYKKELRNDFIIIGTSMVFCPKTNTVGKLIGDTWDIYNLARETYFKNFSYENFDSLSNIIQINIKDFNNLNFFPELIKIESFLENTILKSYEKKISIKKVDKIKYKFKIKNSINDNLFYIWNFVFDFNNNEYDIASPLKLYLKEIGKRFKNLKTKNRKKNIAEILKQISISKNPQEIINNIGQSLPYNLFSNIQIRNEAKSYIKKFWIDFIKSEKYKILANHKEFILIPYNFQKELSIILDVFFILEADIFKDNLDKDVLISKEIMNKNLSLFVKQTSGHDVQVFIEDKVLKPVKLDFSFKVTSDIDWFSLKPEIYCKGNNITEHIWEKLFSGLTSFYDGKTINIIDSDSLKIIESMSKLLDKKNKKKQNDYVRISRLQILDWIELKKMGVNLVLPAKDAEIIDSLLNFDKIKSEILPEKFIGTLRDYQKSAYNWLSFLYTHRLGGCLADDMGLGKTIQVIAFMAGIKEGKIKGSFKEKEKNLIIVPASILFNWKDEIEKFYPDFKTLCYFGLDRKLELDKYDIIITTYDIIIRDFDILKKIKFHIVVFDEAQYIKNIFSKRASISRQIQSDFKICLTGTPLENHMGEYYSIMDIAVPGLIGDDYKKFKRNFDKDENSFEILINRTSPFVLRRKKSDVLKDLPAKIENNVYLELTQHQISLYNYLIESMKLKIENAYVEKKLQTASFIALALIMKLRQLCLSPLFIDKESKDSHSPKIDFLISKLQELICENHCALIFSQFTSFLDIIEKSLKIEKIPYVRLDGSVSLKNRKKLVEEFQNSEKSLFFLVSLKAGGVGLNLTRANYVFHMDPWWNPAVESQATDRTHRIGQMKNVIVTRLLMRHTIEDKMMYLKEKKLHLYEALLGNEKMQKVSNLLKKEDFEFLLEK